MGGVFTSAPYTTPRFLQRKRGSNKNEGRGEAKEHEDRKGKARKEKRKKKEGPQNSCLFYTLLTFDSEKSVMLEGNVEGKTNE